MGYHSVFLGYYYYNNNNNNIKVFVFLIPKMGPQYPWDKWQIYIAPWFFGSLKINFPTLNGQKVNFTPQS